MTGLERLNRLPAPEAERELLACCGSRRWASRLAERRPHPTPQALLDAADDVWWALDETDWDEAFAAHPRIGATRTGEQRGVATAEPETLQALEDGNRRYEERFGRVFLVFATGRTAGEMLAILRERMGNDPDTELRVAAGEQARIARLRLERLIA
jgi:OHCU decarboxylase